METARLDDELFRRVLDVLSCHLLECDPCCQAFMRGDSVMMCSVGQDAFDEWYRF